MFDINVIGILVVKVFIISTEVLNYLSLTYSSFMCHVLCENTSQIFKFSYLLDFNTSNSQFASLVDKHSFQLLTIDLQSFLPAFLYWEIHICSFLCLLSTLTTPIKFDHVKLMYPILCTCESFRLKPSISILPGI